MVRGPELEGYCIDLLEKLSDMLHFKYKVSIVKDGKEDVVDFTQPFLHTGIGILLQKEAALEEASLFHFLTPFTKETWAGILLAYLLSSLCLFLAGSLWLVRALTLQGTIPQPRSLSVRVISAIWWLFGIVVLAAYIAGFSFVLESATDHISIQDFEDLVKQKQLEFGTMEGSSTLQYFKNSKSRVQQLVYESMIKKDSVLTKNYQEAIQRVGFQLRLHRRIHFKIWRSPWTNKLSVAILKLGESGELDYLRSKWWESSCSHEDHDKWSPLKPQTLGGIFLLLALGLVSGMLVAVIELSKQSKAVAG
ncbi:hypothetical protein E2320_006198 [Naja naja]|nr:hypothetical protein E2320_006198 [Naja naja]